MKKILILAYDFPPYVSVGGLRPYNWFRYFSEAGIEPVVVTRQWGNQYGNQLDYIAPGYSDNVEIETTPWGKIIRTPYSPNLANRLMLKYGDRRFRVLRKLITAWFELMQWFFIVGTKANIYKAADNYLKQHAVDMIIATGDPFVLFKYAHSLGKKYKIPWIADYRDPWSHNLERVKISWLRPLHGWFEKKYVGSATAITTVSELLKFKISQLHPQIPIHILPNGYDPEAMEQARSVKPPANRLCFGFAGTLYNWHPWKSFLQVVYQYWQSDPSIRFEINFYGTNKEEEVKQYVALHLANFKEFIFFHKRMPNHELLSKLAANHVMVLFNDYSIMGTKIFDYLGLHRYILLCYMHDEEAMKLKEKYFKLKDVDGLSEQLQADLIEKTKSGMVVNDTNDLFFKLDRLYNEFKKTGSIACHSVGVEKYSRKNQVYELAALIREIINH